MTKSQLIPFKKEHFELIELRDLEREIITDSFKAKILALADSGVSFTVLQDGRILGFMGYVEFWEGTYEVWLIPSMYLPNYPVTFARWAKQLITNLGVIYPGCRVQTASPMDELHERWMKFLGFECEGILKKFNAGRDYKQWARFSNGS